MLGSIPYVLVHRWYVFSFLLAFLLVGTLHWGLGRTFKFLLVGYLIAWASEACSIRHGFPYGFYSYHYEAMQGEIFLAGVPVWDSLSYTFLAFSGWMMAFFLRSRWNRRAPLPELQCSWKTVLLGAFLTMLLDVVIDPVAHRGDQWFLGKVYSYPPGGFYFDVTLSNFAGWFLVAFVILGAFKLTTRLQGIPKSLNSVYLGVGLYLGVYLFNLGITFWIKAYPLALASTAWGVFLLILWRLRSKNRPLIS